VPGPGVRLAVVGGGWAGLSAAVHARLLGHNVTLFEMAAQLGGRARGVEIDGRWVDNGQHILIGAYLQTLRLMREVGVNTDAALLRMPLRLVDPQGHGLRLRAGPPVLAFASAVLRNPGWRWRDKLALLAASAGWFAARFRCAPDTSVAALAAGLPAAVVATLIEPLCVAALNTPARDASGTVFLRILRDALFSGAGSADLLLPRGHLGQTLPGPAAAWLQGNGARIELSHRVQRLERNGAAWRVDGEDFDHVVLATTAVEAARLCGTIAPEWSRVAAALRYEPIVTVYVQSDGARLPEAMLALHADDHAPAQFVFDRGQLGGPPGLLAFVISGAQLWVDRGIAATEQAVLQQADSALRAFMPPSQRTVRSLTEKRATFRCTPLLARPAQRIAPGLQAAGDYVDGPYPATLEGAVRCAVSAVQQLA
jgi:hydroxysqualene dehydroxylase